MLCMWAPKRHSPTSLPLTSGYRYYLLLKSFPVTCRLSFIITCLLITVLIVYCVVILWHLVLQYVRYEQLLSSLTPVLPMAVARSSSSSAAICYALPVIWMTSYLHVSLIARNRQCEKSIYSKWLNRGQRDLTLQHILKLAHQLAAPE